MNSGTYSPSACPTSACPATVTGATTICPGGSTSLSASSGTSYAWNTGASSQTISVGIGTYTVTITNAAGCTAIATATVTVNPAPTASVTGNATICAGQSTILTATGGGTYLWNTGATTSSLTVSPTATTTYAVTVTLNGCTATTTATVNVRPLPNANALATPNPVDTGQTLSLAATGGITYVWAGPPGFPASTQNPLPIVNVTAAHAGTYTVTVTDANGCMNTASVVVMVNTQPNSAVQLMFGHAEGASGDTVLVPVTLKGCPDLLSFQFPFAFVPPTGMQVQVMGATSGAIASSALVFNASPGAVSWFSGSPLMVESGDTLFFIQLVITGNPGDSAALVFPAVLPSVEVGCTFDGMSALADVETVPGWVKILENVIWSGRVIVPKPNSPGVKDVMMDMTKTGPAGTATATTDTTGYYSFAPTTVANMAVLTPSKTINPANGLSTFPLYFMQRFIVGQSTPEINSWYQLVAADVNLDGMVSTFDLLLIQQLIVGQIAVFPNSPSWQFIPTTYPFPVGPLSVFLPNYPTTVTIAPFHSDAVLDFYGIKMGDLFFNADPLQFAAAEDRGGDGPLELYATALALVRAGEPFEVQISAEQFTDLQSVQFCLAFDAERFEFLGLEAPAGSAFAPVFSPEMAKTGSLRCSWFAKSGYPETMPDHAVWLTLRFAARLDVEKPAEFLRLDPATLRSEVMAEGQRRLDVALLQHSGDASSESSAACRWLPARPNPLVGQATLTFELPADGQAEIVVTDALGRTVWQRSGEFFAGQNAVDFQAQHLASGVYTCRLTSTEGGCRAIQLLDIQ